MGISKKIYTITRDNNRFKLNNEDTIEIWGSKLMNTKGYKDSATVNYGQILAPDATVDYRMSKMEDDTASNKSDL